MDFTPDDYQQQVLDALGKLIERHVTVERTRTLSEAGGYDSELDAALTEAGFTSLASGDNGPLTAALAGLEIARVGALSAFTVTSLVAPMVLGEEPAGPVALAEGAGDKPVRFGPHARLLLMLDGDTAKSLETTPDDWTAVDTGRSGLPMGRLKSGVAARARPLPAGSADRLRDWWRVELAVRSAGLIKGAVDRTVDYVRERKQFGRPIGSFQAVQHRLAQLAVKAEGARWLALEAAYREARPDLAATAAAFATGAADQVFRECHQLHGAIGFTREYPLHLWTLPLAQLQRELGGPTQHRRAAAKAVFTNPQVLALSLAPAV